MNIVTGLGPRVGTSWVMKQLHLSGFVVNGHQFLEDHLPRYLNPDGVWELCPTESIPLDGITKVWYPRLKGLSGVQRLLILERKDKEAQFLSMQKSFEEEIKLNENKKLYFNYNIEQTIMDTMRELPSLVSTIPNVLHTYTEELNTDITKILKFFGKEF